MLHLFTCHGRIMPRLAELLFIKLCPLELEFSYAKLVNNISSIFYWILLKFCRSSSCDVKAYTCQFGILIGLNVTELHPFWT